MWLPRYLRMRWDLERVKAEERQFAKTVRDRDYDPNYAHRQDRIYEWRQLVLTTYWVSKADSLGVELPGWDDKTLRGQVDWDDDPREPWYFTPKGVAQVRSDVRAEQKHRREIVAFWLSAAVGVIGALTGLAAILKS